MHVGQLVLHLQLDVPDLHDTMQEVDLFYSQCLYRPGECLS